MVIRRAIPDTLPLFVPEAADETVEFQINAIADALEILERAGLMELKIRPNIEVRCQIRADLGLL